MPELFFSSAKIEIGGQRQQANRHSHVNRVRREANGLVRGLAGLVVRFRCILCGKAGSVLAPSLAEFGVSKRIVGIQTHRLLQKFDRLAAGSQPSAVENKNLTGEPHCEPRGVDWMEQRRSVAGLPNNFTFICSATAFGNFVLTANTSFSSRS